MHAGLKVRLPQCRAGWDSPPLYMQPIWKNTCSQGLGVYVQEKFSYIWPGINTFVLISNQFSVVTVLFLMKPLLASLETELSCAWDCSGLWVECFRMSGMQNFSEIKFCRRHLLVLENLLTSVLLFYLCSLCADSTWVVIKSTAKDFYLP